MTKLTIELDDEVAKRVTEAATDRGVAPEQLAREVVTERFAPRRRFAFIGMGDSGPGGGDIGRRHREVIRESLADKTARDV